MLTNRAALLTVVVFGTLTGIGDMPAAVVRTRGRTRRRAWVAQRAKHPRA